MTLLIATPGLRRPDTAAGVTAASDALPALPALTTLLTRARRLPVTPDWRTGVLKALGAPGDEATIPAVVLAARACPALSAGAALCFATPLHVVAGISRVHLP